MSYPKDHLRVQPLFGVFRFLYPVVKKGFPRTAAGVNLLAHNFGFCWLCFAKRVTGQKIVRAIVARERDPHQLAKLRDVRIQASREEIGKSLEGNWRPELVFVLQQEVDLHEAYRQRITECDQQIEKHLATFADNSNPVQPPSPKGEIKKKRKKPTQNAPAFDLRHELERISGVDLTRIDGIEVMVAQTVLSEVGLDMSRWKTEAHFSSWLGLCPDNRISGDRVLRRGTRRVINRAATALRMAATTMAHRLARLVYRMLKYGQQYVDKGMDHYDQKYRDQQIQSLKKKAAKLGLQLMPALPS